MAYDDLTGREQPILRDYLAAERTLLANERTLLAYLRSALILLVTSLTIFKFFEGDAMLRIVSLALVPASIVIGGFGIYRFRTTRSKLAAFEQQPQTEHTTRFYGSSGFFMGTHNILWCPLFLSERFPIRDLISRSLGALPQTPRFWKA